MSGRGKLRPSVHPWRLKLQEHVLNEPLAVGRPTRFPKGPYRGVGMPVGWLVHERGADALEAAPDNLVDSAVEVRGMPERSVSQRALADASSPRSAPAEQPKHGA